MWYKIEYSGCVWRQNKKTLESTDSADIVAGQEPITKVDYTVSAGLFWKMGENN